MNLKILITFLFFLLQSTTFATQAHGNEGGLHGSSLNYNLAVKHLGNDKLGLAKAHIERSLYLHPLRSAAKRLNSTIDEKIISSLGSMNQEFVPTGHRILDAIPSFISYIILTLALFLLFLALAQMVFKEKSTFKQDPKLKLRTTGAAFLVLCACLLYISKEISSAQQWACIVDSSAPLFTGPDSEKYVQTSSLPQGSCVKLVRLSGDWASLAPRKHKPGWTKRSDILIVRGDKFDPPSNTD